jgi:hypothetical protein
VPFSLFGHTLAPLLWVVVARAGGFFAIGMTYKLAARFAGPWAGVIAAVALIGENVFGYHFLRGNSEGLLAATVLWAVVRHLDGRTWSAFFLGVAAGLLRPEVWPFVALYGLWIVAARWREAPAWRALAVVAGSGLFILVMWFVPEKLGSGDLLRAASRALDPVEGSPGQAAFPFGAAFSNSASALVVPTNVGGVLGVLFAFARRRTHDGAVLLAIAGLSTLLMMSVAAGAQIGFTGNQRYVTLPASLVCVLSGVGWVEAVRAVGRRFGSVLALGLVGVLVLACAPFAVAREHRLHRWWTSIEAQDSHDASISAAIKAVGAKRITSCGIVYASMFDPPRTAYDLHLHINQVYAWQFGINQLPATIFEPLNSSWVSDPEFHPIGRTDRWIIGSSCAVGP